MAAGRLASLWQKILNNRLAMALLSALLGAMVGWLLPHGITRIWDKILPATVTITGPLEGAEIARCVPVSGKVEHLGEGQVWLAEHGDGSDGFYTLRRAIINADDTWQVTIPVGKPELKRDNIKAYTIHAFVVTPEQSQMLETDGWLSKLPGDEQPGNKKIATRHVNRKGTDNADCK